jgi:hypothetical protein
MKTKFPKHPSSGEICLCAVNDGALLLGGVKYEAPLKPGKYIVISFGSDSLLLTECTSESFQLLSEVSRGICLSGGPFHIQAHILRPSRIHPRNRTGKKDTARSSSLRRESQALPESLRPRKGGKGCNLSPASKPTTFRCTPGGCTDRRRNNTQSVFQKLACSWAKNIIKTKKHTQGEKL